MQPIPPLLRNGCFLRMLFSRTIEKTIVEQPDALPVLKLHYLRWFRAPDLRHAGWDLPADQQSPEATGLAAS